MPEEPAGADAVRHTRYRIRERTKQALRDLSFLFYHLPARDRRRVFEEFVRGDGREQLVNVFELCFLGVYSNVSAFEPPDEREIDDPHDAVEWFVRQGVGGAEWELGGYQEKVSVNVDVERWRPDPEAAFERFRAGHATGTELAYLSHWCDEVEFPECVLESGESTRFVRGSAAKFGDRCLGEFTPEDARFWLENEGRLSEVEGEGESEGRDGDGNGNGNGNGNGGGPEVE